MTLSLEREGWVRGNVVDLGREALASHESGEDESSLPKNNAHYKIG